MQWLFKITKKWRRKEYQVSEGTTMYMYAWNCYEIKWNNCGMGFICRMCLRPSSRLEASPWRKVNLVCSRNQRIVLSQNIAKPDLHWVCLHGLESRSERRFGTWFKTWLGSWFELRAFTWATNAFPITIRNCALRVIFCSYYAVRARWLTHALMHGFSAHF